MEKAGLRASELARLSGINKASVSQYLNGSHTPSNFSAAKMGPILGVNPVWLMGFDVPMDPSKETESLRRKTILRRAYPILGGVSGGKPVESNGNRSNHTNNIFNIPADYIYTIEDETMGDGTFYRGDILFIRCQEDFASGACMLLSRNDELMLRRSWIDSASGIVTLTSSWPGSEPEILLPDRLSQVSVIGRVVAVQRIL